jgi:large subunit ribosomal protein L40
MPLVAQIRYHLQHPLTPRPLRFSRYANITTLGSIPTRSLIIVSIRNRALRHWTIHRAWQLYQAKQREQHQSDLERQYNSMRVACEALRLIDNHGLTAAERLKLGEPEAEGQQIGKLYRVAMQKKGIWDGVPIEYARIQTDTPPKDGWNHSWTR